MLLENHNHSFLHLKPSIRSSLDPLGLAGVVPAGTELMSPNVFSFSSGVVPAGIELFIVLFANSQVRVSIFFDLFVSFIF